MSSLTTNRPSAQQATAALMRKVAGIRLLTVRLVDEQLTGAYHSSFKGQGIEFDEVRPYVPGDEVRTIDWNVTARTGFPHIKRFSEERELTVLFLVDVSGSMVPGSRVRTKADLAALLTCILAMAAVRNEDRVGLINFSDRIVKTIPARKGRTAVMRLVRDVLAAEATRHRTDLAAALTFLNNVHKRRALVFVISDFQDRGFENELRTTAVHHDLVALALNDPLERAFPAAGLVELEDPESGGLVLVDTSSPSVRNHFAAQSEAARQALRQTFRRFAIDAEFFCTDEDDDALVARIRRLFRRRDLRGGRRA